MFNVAIIGGGASGLIAACAVSSTIANKLGTDAASKLVKVTIFEATDKVGRPILRSGNGRCNFSNLHIQPELYNNPEFVGEVLRAFEALSDSYLPHPYCECPNGVIKYFSNYGLMWEEIAEGRVYPLTNKASSVLDVFTNQISAFGIDVRTDARVVEVVLPPNSSSRFQVRFADKSIEHADFVICSSGGKTPHEAFPFLPFETIEPVLGSMAVKEKDVKQLDAIRVRGRLSLIRDGASIFCEDGEVLFRKYGVSGIVSFNASRFACEGDTISLDLFPLISTEKLTLTLKERNAVQASISILPVTNMQCLSGIVLPQVSSVILKRLGLDETAAVTDENLSCFAHILKNFEFAYTHIGDPDNCQVMRGGFSVSAVRSDTLETISADNLFICGEALDIDGPCGGFNLHWAFATGLLSGWAIADRILENA